MSTTLDAVKFQKYFTLNKPAPLSEVPAVVVHIPWRHSMRKEPEPDYIEAAIRTVLMIQRADDPGDILFFLTGGEEIEDACHKIKIEADDLLPAQDQGGSGSSLVSPSAHICRLNNNSICSTQDPRSRWPSWTDPPSKSCTTHVSVWNLSW
jgi:HrpA-like RNA helicase